ncbi:regulatory LuxR family protein [Prauserella shujinwangii]|uniref:Regulatory LuxR family protein n=1 Tax=Prauserella shujinwangii TaxID=1453103 RepID=A0A2T0M1F9_9PSEU|nr:LuxR C-terminal-related transcriptional regulator [Prauserella shujinwangii]PRX50407.1 regulatory LuxR family protein [Prauserella shujinwangii]
MLNPSSGKTGFAPNKEFVGLLPDHSAVLRRVQQIACTVTSVGGALSGRGGPRNHVDLSMLDLLADAGKHRRVLIGPQLTDPESLASTAIARQLEVRICPGPVRPMLVFDDRYAVLSLDQADWSAGALLLRAPLAGPCGELFDLKWSAARPVTVEPAVGDALSGRQLDVIRLLLQGATDHQVADRIGVSSRTVRTVVSQLHRRYGTTSRMALGFRLACAGATAEPTERHD